MIDPTVAIYRATENARRTAEQLVENDWSGATINDVAGHAGYALNQILDAIDAIRAELEKR